MNTNELLNHLRNDIAEVSAPKKAHIQIEQIFQAYERRLSEQQPDERPSNLKPIKTQEKEEK